MVKKKSRKVKTHTECFLIFFLILISINPFSIFSQSRELNSKIYQEIHVSKNGSDNNPGTEEKPFLTIQTAANIAQPGDVIIVHEGVYREKINPKYSGESDSKRIIYRAAKGNKVIIKGSEIIKDWINWNGFIWVKKIPNDFFGSFNPYSDIMEGHWFFPEGKTYHTGAVYFNGSLLKEAQFKDELLEETKTALWYAEVDEKNTTIYAQFPNSNPNQELVEINVRQTIFFPEKIGINYITVSGFDLQHAATPWAAPTQPQKGLIGANFSKGWVIENNIISYSKSSGICLGRAKLDTIQPMNAYGMIAGFKYASKHNLWIKEKIGNHIIRDNKISHCGQAGIIGNMGGSFSLIEGNEIFEINTLESYKGMEQGGIKLHGGVDVIIQDNCIYNIGRMGRGIWLDWLGQGSIIRNNLIFNTDMAGLYLEVNHGPIICANNILINSSFTNRSRGSALAHNLFGNSVILANTVRVSPYLLPHDTKILGMHINNHPGDDRYYNNIFASKNPYSMKFGGSKGEPIEYEDEKLPLYMDGNVYVSKNKAYKLDKNASIFNTNDFILNIIKKDNEFYLQWNYDSKWNSSKNRQTITTEILGKTKVSKAKFEYPNGDPLIIDVDYFGKKRNSNNPTPGPFEKINKTEIKVWPK